ncbi:hypothetical protein SCP_0602010 [Sparassis crispa]|uniref:CRIB domain-containing protein n=1 Tax=Sparassis crispa TaxID=139825 RepID=A0A401GPS7_9APHY|nr:hypothetical protein SCP_0602010 [Sparassis crispa]GBE84223.1 hypothetical protein SCP_0602010 [Sparassis crispa]
MDAGSPTGWEESNLRDVYLENHHARCYYCLSDFEKPRRRPAGTGRTTEKQSVSPSEPLRELPCGHVFHRTCIDEWLLKDQRCAVCRQDIFDMPLREDVHPRPPRLLPRPQRPRSISLPSAPPTILMLTNPAPPSLKPKKSRLGFLGKLLHSSTERKHRARDISEPFNFVHLTHIDFDQGAGTFVGMPKEVEDVLHGMTLNGQC